MSNNRKIPTAPAFILSDLHVSINNLLILV